MSLPYSYTNSIRIPAKEGFNRQSINSDLFQYLSQNEFVNGFLEEKGKLTFSFKAFLGIPYHVEMELIQNTSLEIQYDIKLNRLIQVCIALVIFVAFFSSFGVTGFLWFSAILTIVFFALNVMIADKSIRDLIFRILNIQHYDRGSEEILSKEQMEWIKNKSKCPACGEDITEYDRYCPECGLRIREKAPQGPFNVSKYSEKRIKYYFREKKKANDG